MTQQLVVANDTQCQPSHQDAKHEHYNFEFWKSVSLETTKTRQTLSRSSLFTLCKKIFLVIRHEQKRHSEAKAITFHCKYGKSNIFTKCV